MKCLFLHEDGYCPKQNQKITNDEAVEKLEPCGLWVGNVDRCSCCRKYDGSFLRIKNRILYDPSVPLLATNCRELKAEPKRCYARVYSVMVQNS